MRHPQLQSATLVDHGGYCFCNISLGIHIRISRLELIELHEKSEVRMSTSTAYLAYQLTYAHMFVVSLLWHPHIWALFNCWYSIVLPLSTHGPCGNHIILSSMLNGTSRHMMRGSTATVSAKRNRTSVILS